MSSIVRVERRVSLSNLHVRERNRITDDSIGTRSRPRTLIKSHEYFGTMAELEIRTKWPWCLTDRRLAK